MRTAFLLACFVVASLESGAQELSSLNPQTPTEGSRGNQGVSWDSTGPSSQINDQEGTSQDSSEPQNGIFDYPYLYSNQWRPVIMPISLYPFADENIRDVVNDNTDEHQQNPIVYQPTIPVTNKTFASLYPFGSRTQQFYQPQNTIPYPYPSRVLQNNFMSETFPVKPTMLYPPSLSINVRRTYTNNANERQNASNLTQKAVEPITSSYEERYSQVLPPIPFPGMPLIPDRSLSYSSLGYPRQFYPATASPFAPPYQIIPPEARDPLRASENDSVDISDFQREVGADDVPVLQEQPAIERSVPSENSRAAYDVPRGVPNTIAQPNPFPPGILNYPFVLPRRIVSPILPDSRRTEIGRPFPGDVVRTAYDTPSGLPNTFVSPNPIPQSNGQFPSAWQRTIMPPLIPNPIVPRAIPQNPSLVPEDSKLPIDVPFAEVLPSQIRVKDRLPINSNIEGVPLDNPILAGTQEQDSLRTVAESIESLEDPISTKIPYEFGYDMNDGKGTDQHRMEASDAFGVVRGSYGYRDTFGVYRLVNYIADKNGFRAFVKSNEPGVSSSGSADVVVVAEHAPPHAVAEVSTVAEQEAVIVPDGIPDVIAEGSEMDIL